ncbi:APC family permease [Synechococcus sp. UW140]|uniref:APC family permease n=1 Tax=Synechococcus sp. UW140 TaxID=368503 RepID=UPI0025DB1C6B|nr:APC family permease [Synechococcus sp. UW140]
MVQLQRRLSLFSLVMAVVTSTIGSGWLFAPYLTAQLAGPASLFSWLAGGAMAFLIALVFAELGVLVSSSGALAQIPLLTHGRTSGFIGGWTAWLGYVALPAIEVLATVQYLGSSLPWLNRTDAACLLLLLFGWINLAGIATLSRWIDGLTIWKLFVPLGVSIALIYCAANWSNLHVAGYESNGIFDALSAGGILFSLLGFRTAMDLAGEAKNPQRDVPLAMGVGLAISLFVYLVLQLAFLLAVPPAMLDKGWSGLQLTAHGGPLVALAMGLGLSWLSGLLITDALISPSATSMAYMGTAARVNWMLARCKLLPAPFAHINKAGVPSVALAATVLIGLILLQGGSTWGKAVGFVTSALVISLAVGPVSLMALRQQAPEVFRPYRLPAARFLCPLAFVFATWAIFWCGWASLQLALPSILIPSFIYLLVKRCKNVELKSSLWWFIYLLGIGLASYLIGPNRFFPLHLGLQLVLLTVFALTIFMWALRSKLLKHSPHAMVKFSAD